ncbi:hypothetical protein D3C81_2125260 [compost metagenome]
MADIAKLIGTAALLGHVAEVVLPSGRFASCRLPRFRDILGASGAGGQMHMLAAIACSVVTIDGDALDVEQFLDMPPSEAIPIIDMVSRVLSGKVGRGATHA